jgi:hypothetical protein
VQHGAQGFGGGHVHRPVEGRDLGTPVGQGLAGHRAARQDLHGRLSRVGRRRWWCGRGCRTGRAATEQAAEQIGSACRRGGRCCDTWGRGGGQRRRPPFAGLAQRL